jgi:hypothetical protein
MGGAMTYLWFKGKYQHEVNRFVKHIHTLSVEQVGQANKYLQLEDYVVRINKDIFDLSPPDCSGIVDYIFLVTVHERIFHDFRPDGVYEEFGASLRAKRGIYTVNGFGGSCQSISIEGPDINSVKNLLLGFLQGTVNPSIRLCTENKIKRVAPLAEKTLK